MLTVRSLDVVNQTADKIEDPKCRMEELRKLVRNLPKHNYHTLKHVVLHLKRVADNSHLNRMEAKNLAIVFGPTIVRPDSEPMESMVTNMNNQCKIVESLIANAEWFFPESDNESVPPTVQLAIPDHGDDSDVNNQALLNNIGKYEAALKDQKEKNGALLSSLFTAAHRKVMRKPSRTHTHDASRDEPTTPTHLRTFDEFAANEKRRFAGADQSEMGAKAIIPTTVMELESGDKPSAQTDRNWFNYKTDQSDFSRRIQIFKQETEAMLQRPRKTEISVSNIDAKSGGPLSVSATNVNVCARAAPAANQNSRNSMDSAHFKGGARAEAARHSYGAGLAPFGDVARLGLRRGSSVENVNASVLDVNSNGGLKKVRYEPEGDSQRKGSLDSLHKIPTDDGECAQCARSVQGGPNYSRRKMSCVANKAGRRVIEAKIQLSHPVQAAVAPFPDGGRCGHLRLPPNGRRAPATCTIGSKS
ncbi:hypothetical protein HUJ05_010976 [Dendroctonus ponderosae]|nr:hypothetical protein HUJ05_010976 [Dendroctonus ponderosae]